MTLCRTVTERAAWISSRATSTVSHDREERRNLRVGGTDSTNTISPGAMSRGHSLKRWSRHNVPRSIGNSKSCVGAISFKRRPGTTPKRIVASHVGPNHGCFITGMKSDTSSATHLANAGVLLFQHIWVCLDCDFSQFSTGIAQCRSPIQKETVDQSCRKSERSVLSVRVSLTQG